MKVNFVRNVVCSTLLAALPAAAMASGAGTAAGTAMVHPYGSSWLNGVAVDHASVIFPGDLVQTNAGSVLKIDGTGSTVTVLSDSLVKFNGDSAVVERGGATLKTPGTMSAHAGIVTVTPATGVQTEYQVTRSNGTVKVVAVKGDLRISNGSQTTTLRQGQQATQVGVDKLVKMEGVSTASANGSKGSLFVIQSASKSATENPVRPVTPLVTKVGSGTKP